MTQILVTNDDGIHAPGLRALVEALDGLGTLSVVAPSFERSGTAQSITLRHPIYCEQVNDREWAVDGTPTDAMILALNKLLPEHPDLVISGVNRGGNLGENVYYSGTVGAAVEATINQIPAVAISVAYRGPNFDFRDAARLGRELAKLILEEGLPRGIMLNVNVPLPWNGKVCFTRQSEKVTRNLLQENKDPRGCVYYWLHEQQLKEGIEPDTDYAAVHSGAVSITPIQLDRTHATSLNHLSHWTKKLESLHPPR